jgi:hypothetical protein
MKFNSQHSASPNNLRNAMHNAMHPRGKEKKGTKTLRILHIIAVAQWLRCCATNRKVAGSIPDGVTGIFH